MQMGKNPRDSQGKRYLRVPARFGVLKGTHAYDLHVGSSDNALAPAELVDPDGIISRDIARGRFIQMLNSVAPSVVNDLKMGPYRSGSQLLGRLFEHLKLNPDNMEYQPLSDSIFHATILDLVLGEELRLFRTQLREWAKRHHLDAEWLLRAVTRNFTTWWTIELGGQPSGPDDGPAWNNAVNIFYPWLGEDVDQFVGVFKTPTTKPVRMLFELEWDPRRETRQLVRAQAMTELSRMLDDALDHIAATSRASGDLPVPVRKHLTLHLAWLIRWQVLGQSYSQIASSRSNSDKSVTPQAISKAVLSLAQLVELPARPVQTGRPRRRPPARVIRVEPRVEGAKHQPGKITLAR